MFVALVLCEKVASVAWKNLASIYAIICSQKSNNRLKNKNNTTNIGNIKYPVFEKNQILTIRIIMFGIKKLYLNLL